MKPEKKLILKKNSLLMDYNKFSKHDYRLEKDKFKYREVRK